MNYRIEGLVLSRAEGPKTCRPREKLKKISLKVAGVRVRRIACLPADLSAKALASAGALAQVG